MDQQALRQMEKRCIQEEPPWCTAACPLHVDVRALAGHIGSGRWEEAWMLLRRHMPLPGILGRICDAPCQEPCKRNEAGGAIRIGALERACVQTDAPVVRIQTLPAKGKRVAVAGSGLSSLSAAWDLVRKGYAVTVFEARDRTGAPLRQLASDLLPEAVITRETARLGQLGVCFELGCNPDTPVVYQRCLNDFDAVYLGLDAVEGHGWGLDRDADGRICIEGKSQATKRPGIFAGGQLSSPVWQSAQGRWAATSIDRFLQDVSLTSGRDREGPVETRLFTSLSDVSATPPVPMADTAGYTPTEAMAEARRCLQCECMACVRACVYLEKFGAYPKKYAREIYNNLSIVMGDHKANRLINSCSLCGLCQQVCPNDFPMPQLCLQARQTMVETGKMPPSAHEFALLDMAFSQSERFAMARHQPGFETSTYAFFPGCQLCASAPNQVQQVYAHLCKTLPGGVGLILGCCAAPAHWAGERRQFETQAETLQAQWATLGQPRIIMACSTCLQMVETHLPMISADSLWPVIESSLPAAVVLERLRPLAVHDPCTTRSRSDVQICVRRILSDRGITIQELALGREFTECCGSGGLMQNANPELAMEVTLRRARRSDSDTLTYCAMCRDNLAATGKRAVYLLDFFFPDSLGSDPALRPRPGWSQRQENRTRLKAHLLHRLWNEVSPDMNLPTIQLEISPQVAQLLDHRRILTEDLQQVIQHAETSGQRLFHPASGRYKAAFAPYKVTFWVEYTPTGAGYVVHNAYAHRMEVLGP